MSKKNEGDNLDLTDEFKVYEVIKAAGVEQKTATSLAKTFSEEAKAQSSGHLLSSRIVLGLQIIAAVVLYQQTQNFNESLQNLDDARASGETLQLIGGSIPKGMTLVNKANFESLQNVFDEQNDRLKDQGNEIDRLSDIILDEREFHSANRKSFCFWMKKSEVNYRELYNTLISVQDMTDLVFKDGYYMDGAGNAVMEPENLEKLPAMGCGLWVMPPEF